MDKFNISNTVNILKNDLRNIDETAWKKYIRRNLLWGSLGGSIAGMLIAVGLGRRKLTDALWGGLIGFSGGALGGTIAGYKFALRNKSMQLKNHLKQILDSNL